MLFSKSHLKRDVVNATSTISGYGMNLKKKGEKETKRKVLMVAQSAVVGGLLKHATAEAAPCCMADAYWLNIQQQSSGGAAKIEHCF